MHVPGNDSVPVLEGGDRSLPLLVGAYLTNHALGNRENAIFSLAGLANTTIEAVERWLVCDFDAISSRDLLDAINSAAKTWLQERGQNVDSEERRVKKTESIVLNHNIVSQMIETFGDVATSNTLLDFASRLPEATSHIPDEIVEHTTTHPNLPPRSALKYVYTSNSNPQNSNLFLRELLKPMPSLLPDQSPIKNGFSPQCKQVLFHALSYSARNTPPCAKGVSKSELSVSNREVTANFPTVQKRHHSYRQMNAFEHYMQRKSSLINSFVPTLSKWSAASSKEHSSSVKASLSQPPNEVMPQSFQVPIRLSLHLSIPEVQSILKAQEKQVDEEVKNPPADTQSSAAEDAALEDPKSIEKDAKPGDLSTPNETNVAEDIITDKVENSVPPNAEDSNLNLASFEISPETELYEYVDTFLWDLRDTDTSPYQFAQFYCESENLPVRCVAEVYTSIIRQLIEASSQILPTVHDLEKLFGCTNLYHPIGTYLLLCDSLPSPAKVGEKRIRDDIYGSESISHSVPQSETLQTDIANPEAPKENHTESVQLSDLFQSNATKGIPHYRWRLFYPLESVAFYSRIGVSVGVNPFWQLASSSASTSTPSAYCYLQSEAKRYENLVEIQPYLTSAEFRLRLVDAIESTFHTVVSVFHSQLKCESSSKEEDVATMITQIQNSSAVHGQISPVCMHCLLRAYYPEKIQILQQKKNAITEKLGKDMALECSRCSATKNQPATVDFAPSPILTSNSVTLFPAILTNENVPRSFPITVHFCPIAPVQWNAALALLHNIVNGAATSSPDAIVLKSLDAHKGNSQHFNKLYLLQLNFDPYEVMIPINIRVSSLRVSGSLGVDLRYFCAMMNSRNTALRIGGNQIHSARVVNNSQQPDFVHSISMFLTLVIGSLFNTIAQSTDDHPSALAELSRSSSSRQKSSLVKVRASKQGKSKRQTDEMITATEHLFSLVLHDALAKSMNVLSSSAIGNCETNRSSDDEQHDDSSPPNEALLSDSEKLFFSRQIPEHLRKVQLTCTLSNEERTDASLFIFDEPVIALRPIQQ